MPDFEDASATRVMPPATPPGAPPGLGSPPGGPGYPPKPDRTWLWVALGVVGGLVVGGILAWIAFGWGAKSANNAASTTPTSTVAASSTVPPSTTTAPVAPSTTTQPVTPAEPTADTTPPNTPKITFPPANYWLSPDNLTVELKWNAVSDPSGVSYVIEHAEWLGGGAGWTDSARTAPVKRRYLEFTEKGIKERYRIIAIDGAGNESDPSAYRFLIPATSASEAASLNASY